MSTSTNSEPRPSHPSHVLRTHGIGHVLSLHLLSVSLGHALAVNVGRLASCRFDVEIAHIDHEVIVPINTRAVLGIPPGLGISPKEDFICQSCRKPKGTFKKSPCIFSVLITPTVSITTAMTLGRDRIGFTLPGNLTLASICPVTQKKVSATVNEVRLALAGGSQY